jgi:hypothetical protein
MADEHLQMAERFLARHGIETFWVESLSKHRRLVVEYGGKQHRVVIPSSGSDRRGPLNMVGDLRRLLNLPRKERPVGKPAERAAKPKRHVRPRHLTMFDPDLDAPVRRIDKFYGPLERLRAQLAATAVAAPAAPPPADFMIRPSETRFRLRTPWLGRQTRYCVL